MLFVGGPSQNRTMSPDSSFTIMSLENRVAQLEQKVQAMTSRGRKEVIWKKQLEDWILKTFNYDLRLQVELKLVETEGEGGSYDDRDRDPSSNFGRGATTITPISLNSTTTASKFGNASSYSKTRQISPHVSITVAPSTDTLNRNPLQRNRPVLGIPRHPPGPRPQNVRPQQQYIVSQQFRSRGPVKRRRLVGPASMARRPLQLQTAALPAANRQKTPIIVSTTSMAPKHPPEIITLEDDDDCQDQGQVQEHDTHQHQDSRDPLSFSGLLPSVSESSQQVSYSISSVNSEVVCTYTSNSGSSATANPVSALSNVVSSIPSSDPLTDCASGTAANPLTVGMGDYFGPGGGIGSIDDILNASFDLNHYNNGIDAENSNEMESSLPPNNMIQMESAYAASNYLTRNDGELLFNIQKIILDKDPNLHADLINYQMTGVLNPSNVEMPVHVQRRINAPICNFLLQVYGDRVTRHAKEAMAESLFREFPSAPKDVWFKVNPGKSNSGLIENRINNIKREMKRRKGLEQ